jgi:ABC-type spermidine/putrescine transport system permease subunit II
VVREGADNAGARDALVASLKAALGATGIALLLGTLAALAVLPVYLAARLARDETSGLSGAR